MQSPVDDSLVVFIGKYNIVPLQVAIPLMPIINSNY